MAVAKPREKGIVEKTKQNKQSGRCLYLRDNVYNDAGEVVRQEVCWMKLFTCAAN